MLVAGDVYRPAAIDQLAILGKQVLGFYILEIDQLQFLEKLTSIIWSQECHFKFSIKFIFSFGAHTLMLLLV